MKKIIVLSLSLLVLFSCSKENNLNDIQAPANVNQNNVVETVDNNTNIEEEEVEEKSEEAIALHNLETKWETARLSWNYKEAIKYYEEALATDNENSRLLLSLWYLYYADNNIEKTLDTFNKYLTLFPTDTAVLNRIWNIYSELWNVDKSREFYLKSLDIDPDNNQLLRFIGSSYFTESDFKEAEKFFIKSYNLKKNYHTLKTLALIKSYENNYKESAKYYSEIEWIKKPDLMNYIIILLLDKKYNAIIAEYNKHYTDSSVLSWRADKNIERYYFYANFILWNKAEADKSLARLQKYYPQDTNVLLDMYLLNRDEKVLENLRK